MLARLARRIGERLAVALELPETAAERAAFALESLFLFVLTSAAILAAAALCGVFWPALAAAVTGAFLRKLSGGAHFSTPWRCILVSTLLAILFGLAGRLLSPFLARAPLAAVVCATAFAAAAVLSRYAPAETPAKPIPEPQRKTLKALSLLFLAAWMPGMLLLPLGRDLLAASTIGLAWQVFSITPAGYCLYRSIDGLWTGGGEKECASSY